MRQWAAASLACGLATAGCAGTGIEMGGVDAPAERPAETVDCAELDMTRFNKLPKPEFPEELAMFLFLGQKEVSYDPLLFSYDIDPAGNTANIRFAGHSSYLEHGTYQEVIRRSGETIAKWSYDWGSDPGPRFATGCRTQINYVADWRERYRPGVDDEDEFGDRVAKSAREALAEED